MLDPRQNNFGDLQESVGQVSPPRISRGAGIAFSLPGMQLAIETPLNSISCPDVNIGTSLTTFNATAEVNAAVSNFFDLRSLGAPPCSCNGQESATAM